MKKAVILGMSTAVLSTAVLAAPNTSNAIIMDGDEDTIQITNESTKKRYGPMRTHFFSGIEREETVYDKSSQITSMRYIIADGSTRLHKNFRMRFYLADTQTVEGKRQDDRGGRINYTLAPRYEKWVSPKFSYFFEPVLLRRANSDGSENSEVKLKPGAQFTYGKHFIATTAEYKMIHRERYKTDQNGYDPVRLEDLKYDAYNAEASYVYRYTPKLNFGVVGVVNGTVDNDEYNVRNKGMSVKPFVRLRHWNNMVTEFNVRLARTESGEFWTGHNSYDLNLNNNYPLNRNIRLVANVGYRVGDEHTSSKYSWGDREGLFLRVGANLSF